jgi:hypothetical protein
MTYVLGRQYKDLKPVLQVLRQSQAPLTRGFLLGVPDLSPFPVSRHEWRAWLIGNSG